MAIMLNGRVNDFHKCAYDWHCCSYIKSGKDKKKARRIIRARDKVKAKKEILSYYK